MNREQCYNLEIQNLKFCLRSILISNHTDEACINYLIKSCHQNAWKNYKEEK